MTMYPICVRYYDEKLQQVLSVLLCIRDYKKAPTGENIYKIIEAETENSKIQWMNLM